MANSSPEPSEVTDITFTDDAPGSPSSPSLSISSISTFSASISDFSDSEEPVVSKRKGRTRVPGTKHFPRTWPAADEIALLEAVVAHLETNDLMPSPEDLAVALRGRILSEHRLSVNEITNRLHLLRYRYLIAVEKLSHGTVPVPDDDVTIYKLSKRIWLGTTRSRRLKRNRVTDVREVPRDSSEMAVLYPHLSRMVEEVEARHGGSAAGFYKGCKRLLQKLGDDTAARLEAKVKKLHIDEIKAKIKGESLQIEVLKLLLN